ncbi:MAG: peptide ligase PGM1-related protein [Prochloraceae cyanobacterium]
MQTFNYSCSAKTDRFEELQSKLRDRWQGVDLFEEDDCDILVVPSLSIDQREAQKIAGLLHYEERLLFSLIRLRNPHTRLIYITAIPLSPLIIDYYLQMLPGIPFSHARDRLLLTTTYDASLKPLTQKILERPRLVERIRRALRPGKSYMVCYNASILEQELSIQLGIPLLAPSPQLLHWGSKSGSREIFAECNVPHPDGSLKVNNVEDLLKEAAELWERQPHLKRMVIKLNEGFSGEGNALLDLQPIQNFAPSVASHTARIAALRDRLPHLRFQARHETWTNFSSRIPELGAIAEAYIEGEHKRSPSVQGYITPSGEVEILSTHDQILGGPDEQIYLGCSFPAEAAYRLRLQEMGIRVGKALAAKGAMERYGVDFVAVRQSNPGMEKWDIQAIEINLRKGGTTHPFMILKLLTNGNYDYQTGLFYSQEGQEKYYIASDNLQKKRYQGLLPSDLMDIIAKHRLHFDTSTTNGTVFHLMGALSEFGKLGLTCIGNSLKEAKELNDRVEKVLDSETESTLDSSCGTSSHSLPIRWI